MLSALITTRHSYPASAPGGTTMASRGGAEAQREIHLLNEAPSRTRGSAVAWRAVKEGGSPASTAPSRVRAQARGDRRVPRHRPRSAVLSRRSPRTACRTWDGPRHAGEPVSFTARQRWVRGRDREALRSGSEFSPRRLSPRLRASA
jgi:hypothetical protein